jgi:large subunit ribosomal protein L35
VLNGEWKIGPPSLKTRKAKLAYNSPVGLQQVFEHAKDIVKKESENHYKAAQELSKTDDAIKNNREINKHLVRAELHNPEVQYNFKMKKIDLTVPIYRYLSEREWRSREMLIMIQRLETLHVIPDTLPTITPKAAVSLQFPGVINKWIEPGTILQTKVCMRRPVIKIQEFEKIADDSLYTVLIVDPDTPDLENDTFKTTLHWAVTNIPLSNVNHEVDVSMANELVTYLPPHPEKNSPTHRYCVWVFRQSSTPEQIRKLDFALDDEPLLTRDNFKIRQFVEKHQLVPVGAHLWRCDYDRTTDEVRTKFGLGEGLVYRRQRTQFLQHSIPMKLE